MARQIKLTNSATDRKSQRDRTKRLINETADMEKLQETPPKNLVGIARYTWTQIVPILNEQKWLKQTDKAVVEQLCVQIAIYREAYDNIFTTHENKKGEEVCEGIQTPIYKHLQDNTGAVVGVDFAGYKANPSVKILDSATAKIKTLSEALGMTPQARASLLNISDDTQGATLDDLKKAFG